MVPWCRHLRGSEVPLFSSEVRRWKTMGGTVILSLLNTPVTSLLRAWRVLRWWQTILLQSVMVPRLNWTIQLLWCYSTKQCQWLLRKLQFQYRNCCNQTRHGASPAILQGKPGPTEGAQRMSLLGSRKLFASIVLLSWWLSAQPVDYGILYIPSPSLQ